METEKVPTMAHFRDTNEQVQEAKVIACAALALGAFAFLIACFK